MYIQNSQYPFSNSKILVVGQVINKTVEQWPCRRPFSTRPSSSCNNTSLAMHFPNRSGQALLRAKEYNIKSVLSTP